MRHNKFYPWIVVALLWVVALLNYMDRQMLSTMQEAMKADIAELNKAEAFGALMAVFLWIYGIVSPFAGVVADRVSRKWLVVGSLFVWSAVTYLMGYATDFTQLYWLRALMGISEALYIPSALSLIALTRHRHPHDRTVCRSGSRRLWRHYSSYLLMAQHLPLVWNHRHSLLRSIGIVPYGQA